MWQERDITKVYQKGDVIINEDDPGNEMFIIKTGSVDVVKGRGDKKVILTTLKRGDFFGEMSIMEDLLRSATVIAREETHLIILNSGNFLLKIRKDPTFAFSIMQKMSNRIRVLSEKIMSQKFASKPGLSKTRKMEAEVEYLSDNKS